MKKDFGIDYRRCNGCSHLDWRIWRRFKTYSSRKKRDEALRELLEMRSETVEYQESER
jgi:hypothetical protein